MANTHNVSMAFEAESEGPPRRKLYLWKELPIPNDAPPEMVSGWGFSVSEYDEDGREQPYWDTWEATYEEIILYPDQYAPRNLIWINCATGEHVDIYNL